MAAKQTSMKGQKCPLSVFVKKSSCVKTGSRKNNGSPVDMNKPVEADSSPAKNELKNSYKGAFAKIAKKLHRQTCSDSKPRVDTGVYGPEGKRNDVIISQPYLLHCGQLLNTGTKPKKVSLKKSHPYAPGAIKGLFWNKAERLERGMFGTVYSVYYKHQRAGLKIQDTTQAALNEVTYLKQALPHPNIMPLLAYARSRKFVVTLSPLAVCDLNQLIRHCGSIPRPVIPFIMACIASAIKHLHGRTIAHRDVKDENILILTDGTPVLCDFACASKFNRRHFICAPSIDPIGTEGFIPPELVAGLCSGPAMDIWGLGITACLCMHGHIPYCQLMSEIDPLFKNSNIPYLYLISLCKFSHEEDLFLKAYFQTNCIKRLNEFNLVLKSNYFADIDFDAIKRGHRINKWHEQMEEMVESYLECKEQHKDDHNMGNQNNTCNNNNACINIACVQSCDYIDDFDSESTGTIVDLDLSHVSNQRNLYLNDSFDTVEEEDNKVSYARLRSKKKSIFPIRKGKTRDQPQRRKL